MSPAERRKLGIKSGESLPDVRGADGAVNLDLKVSSREAGKEKK